MSTHCPVQTGSPTTSSIPHQTTVLKFEIGIPDNKPTHILLTQMFHILVFWQYLQHPTEQDRSLCKTGEFLSPEERMTRYCNISCKELGKSMTRLWGFMHQMTPFTYLYFSAYRVQKGHLSALYMYLTLVQIGERSFGAWILITMSYFCWVKSSSFSGLWKSGMHTVVCQPKGACRFSLRPPGLGIEKLSDQMSGKK